MTKAFLDCYIWEITAWPREGVKFDHYAISRIFKYNSLLDTDYSRSTTDLRIQIPDFLITGINDTVQHPSLRAIGDYKNAAELVYANQDRIISGKYPILKREVNERIQEESWELDLNMLFFDPGSWNRERDHLAQC